MTRKDIKLEAARYQKYVEWSDEDQCFIARCPALFGGGVHGSDEARVYGELCQAAEEWIELLHKDKTPLPEHLGERSSAASLCCGSNRRCTGAWRPKPSPPAKASTAIVSRLWSRRK